MDCVLVGHSFVRRLRDHYLPRGMRYRDVGPTHVERAAQLAAKLDMNKNFTGVYTESDGMVYIRHLESTRQTIQAVKPAVVVIDIGSNDIAKLTAVNLSRILDMVNEVYEFACSLSVSLVVFNAVLPRTAGLSCSPTVFRTNATRFNKLLRGLAGGRGSPHLAFNEQRGFFGEGYAMIDRSVSRWSHDGIHASEDSIVRYRNRTRQCIFAHLYLFVSL